MARPQGRQSLNVSCLRSLVSPLLPAIGRAAARPLVGRGLRTRRVNGTPLDRPRPARSRLAVRAPCAHQWLAKASHKAKRFQKHFGSAKGFAKGPAYRLKLFSIFFQKPPCAQRHDVESLRRLKDQTRFTASLGWLEESPIVRRVPCDPATKQVEKGSVEKVPTFAANVTC